MTFGESTCFMSVAVPLGMNLALYDAIQYIKHIFLSIKPPLNCSLLCNPGSSHIRLLIKADMILQAVTLDKHSGCGNFRFNRMILIQNVLV